jgi:phenylacetic acid degradation operon negative regulatory protein
MTSPILAAPVSYFVYSSISFFGSRRGGELPGLWFVAALAEVGCDEAAVRKTLHRMERSAELTSRRDGREKLYAPTAYAQGEITAGTDKIFREPEPWDGSWTMIFARFRSDERIHRDRLQALLQVEGFATIGPGMHLHPRPRGELVLRAVDPRVRERLYVFRGDRAGTESESGFIARHWDVPALAERHANVIRELERLAAATEGGVTDVEAFRYRFEVVIRYLTVAWDDPDLPRTLLPDPWPGDAARKLAARLYRRFLPGAHRFGDQVLTRIGRTDLASTEG